MTRSQDLWARIRREMSQGWAILVQDVRTYYFSTPMIMWGLLLPFFLFTPLLMQQGMTLQRGMASLLAMITFLTASSTGPVIIPLERRTRTYDRLLAAPMSLVTVLLSKALVGVFFCSVVCGISLLAGVLFFGVTIASPLLLVVSIVVSALAFSALGILFGSGAATSPGQIMMPSMLLRWPLLFISGVFVPLEQMSPYLRALAYLSPLTYTQDVLTTAIMGGTYEVEKITKPCGRVVEQFGDMVSGVQSPLLDLAILLCLMAAFLIPALKLHDRSRRLGY